MKSTTTAYALAASFLPFVLASPFHQQRHAAVEVVTNVDVVTAYDQVYVTQYEGAGDAPASTPAAAPPAPATTLVTVAASPSSQAAAPSSSQDSGNWGEHNHQHNNWNRPSSWDGQNSWNAPSSTPVAAPPTTSSTSTPPPPPPAPTTTSTPPPPPPAPTTTSTPPPPPPAPTTTSTPPPPPPAPTTTSTPPAVVAPTPAKTTPSAAAKATLAPYQTGDASYAQDSMKASSLNATNVWRLEYSVNPVAWNESLASMAQNTANACNWEHTNAGQNYAAGYAGPGVAVDSWGGESSTFNFANPDFSESCGHFTQLVWKDSTTMGCAAHKCPTDGSTSASGWFFVCNYFPVGNMLGEFSENVASKNSLSPY